jgi:Bacterial TSP3 repeat
VSWKGVITAEDPGSLVLSLLAVDRKTLRQGGGFVIALLVAAAWWCCPRQACAQLDDACFVSALNRTARVQPDGAWVLPNVPSNSGPVRVRATCVEDGVVRSGQSGLVTIPPNGVVSVPDIDFGSPVPIPERLELLAPAAALTAAGQTVQLQALATYPGGGVGDVTAALAGTDYRSSNAAIASVGADGQVTAQASGSVLVSALNEGALAVVRLTVVLSGDSDGDGLPDDYELAHGLDPNDPVDALEDPDGDGLTTLEEYLGGLDPFDEDTDDDGLLDGQEVGVYGTDPLLFDTDGDGLGDGLEIATGSDPLDPASFNLAAALSSIEVSPAVSRLLFNVVVGEASRQLRVTGRLIDGNSIDLTSRSYGTAYSSSDLLVANFGAEDGRVYAGQDGQATVTAANGGSSAAGGSSSRGSER